MRCRLVTFVEKVLLCFCASVIRADFANVLFV